MESRTPPADSQADLRALQRRVDRLEQRVSTAADPDALTLLVFSGELDRLLAAFTVATGAAASGLRVSMFFTFWGTAALRQRAIHRGKPLVERAFSLLLPTRQGSQALSRLNLGGIGRWLLGREMRHKQISSLPEHIEQAAALGISLYVCEMSMALMGIRREELIDYPDLGFCGVAQFVDLAAGANTSLFI